jgi:integrase
MLMLSGQRLREVTEMGWAEINLDEALWTIPPERSKVGAAHVVPLAPTALGLLRELRNRAIPGASVGGKAALPIWDRGGFIFSTTRGEKAVNGFSKCKVRLDKLISTARSQTRAGKGTAPAGQDQMPAWILHDIRRSMRTNLSALPVEDVVREAVIGHLPSGIKKVYDRYSRLGEKRRCLELWEARLKTFVEPPPADVANLDEARKKKARGKRRSAQASAS